MKEPGQTAYEAWWGDRTGVLWSKNHGAFQASWARAEQTIRLATLEEAAKVARDTFNRDDSRELCAGHYIAAAILALKEKKDG
jgi:hypothetical protein